MHVHFSQLHSRLYHGRWSECLYLIHKGKYFNPFSFSDNAVPWFSVTVPVLVFCYPVNFSAKTQLQLPRHSPKLCQPQHYITSAYGRDWSALWFYGIFFHQSHWLNREVLGFLQKQMHISSFFLTESDSDSSSLISKLAWKKKEKERKLLQINQTF